MLCAGMKLTWKGFFTYAHMPHVKKKLICSDLTKRERESLNNAADGIQKFIKYSSLFVSTSPSLRHTQTYSFIISFVKCIKKERQELLLKIDRILSAHTKN